MLCLFHVIKGEAGVEFQTHNLVKMGSDSRIFTGLPVNLREKKYAENR